eukprot:CAMPEP_0177693374 /NCGR_PEP_ID=MMETSP0484_2-20121128/2365_1 /TAXON_ID=354590 /ORGANISM="Rhodomonas lens, Strain RHODO" /LENGTH=384 /DNA_ID=CAMNT_0019204179 /DNA_START=289 /DNA_END=1441 /DNA_ORIENTATION=-
MTKGQGAAVTSWLLLSICIGTVHAQTFQWTAVGGTLTVDPIAGFFSCSLEEDTALYPDEAACRARCRAGSCGQVFDRVTLTEKTAMEAILEPSLRVRDTLRIQVTAPMVQVSLDPGLPIGMTASPGVAANTLVLEWTPRIGQEGYLHELVLVGGAAGTDTLKVQIPVLPEATHWVSPMEMEEVEAVVGMPISVDFQCVSNYGIQVTWTELPAGMTVTMTEMARRTMGGRLSFTPAHGQEGHQWHVCFDCASHVFQVPQRRCVGVSVALCRYATQPGDTLLSISRAFHRSNNWRRLWNANAGMVADPQSVLSGGTVLAIGPVYTVQPGDSLAGIAGRFDTTVRNLLEMNPFISDETRIMAGVEVCVTACTTKPNPSLDDASPTEG